MEDSAKALAAETELKKYGQFLDNVGDQFEAYKENCHSQDIWPFLKLSSSPQEHSKPLYVLAQTDNAMLGKVVLALSSLCKEADFCFEEAKGEFYNVLLLYGEDLDDKSSLCGVSKMLATIQKLDGFVSHCADVILNGVHQLSALRDSKSTAGAASFAASPDVHPQIVFESLSRLLTAMVTLDGIMMQQETLKNHWSFYRRMIKAAQMDCDKYKVTKEQMKRLDKLLGPAEKRVMESNMFKACVDQQFNKSGVFFVSKNAAFCDELNFAMKTILADVEANLVNMMDPGQKSKLVGLAAMMVLHYNLFQTLDKKFLNKVWEVCKKVPGVTLHGNVMWFPEQFLLANLPSLAKSVDKKLMQVLASNRQTFLQAKGQSASLDTKQLHHQLNGWVIRMESGFKRQISQLTLEHLQRVTDLLLQGIQFASTLNSNINTVLNLHGKLSIPLTKTSVIALCKMMEMLKAVEFMFNRHSLAIVTMVTHICQHLSFLVINIVGRAKRGVIAEKKYTQTRLDILSALVLAETTVAGPPTRDRMLVTKLALAFAAQNRTFKDEEMSSLSTYLQRLLLVSQIQTNITMACDTSFLYWHRVIVATYFDHIYETKTDAYRIQYILSALRDCTFPLSSAKHVETVGQLKNAFTDEIKNYFKEKVLLPLCRDLETDLRLQAHSHLQLDDRNPFKVPLHDVSAFLKVPPIHFLNSYIDIKASVEAYLEKTFYNLTTVALHNWRTYGEMRSLAAHKYEAVTVEDHLPAQTLEQGLDVLEIMRNIHVFVSQYTYNLNNQIFVEQSSQNKHLNTINITHIANSIRTHGTGIMNTTVNFTYQFLRKKFAIFSQFLYDEHIKSRLTKDARYFREHQAKLNQKYPFDRASKFNKSIRKLGMPDGKTTYLDQFRMLITQMGNAMGYVRMIRSGGLHFVSNSIRFIPDLDDIPNFEQLSIEEGMSDDATQAAKTLDEVVQNLAKNFSEGNEYFQLLVNVFGKQLNDQKHSHLKNFYIVIPPLTVNFIEHMVAAKEKLSKNNQNGAAFTDDGLAMGIAYILRLLNQWNTFDSLHWFQSVEEMYDIEKNQVKKQRAEATDEKLQQTLALTLKRLDTYQKEFELLHFGLSSARIFFRATDDDDDDDNDDDDDGKSSVASGETSAKIGK